MKKYDELVKSNNSKTTSNDNLSAGSINFGSIVKYFGAFGAASAVMLYFLGYIYNQSYLGVWGINAGIFPLQYKDIVIYGFFPIFYGISNAVTLLEKLTLLNFISAFLALTLYVLLIIKLSSAIDKKLSKKIKQIGSGNSQKGKYEKVKFFIRDFIISGWIPIIVIFGIPVAIYTTAVVLAMPVILADTAGKQAAYKDKKQYDSGCIGELSSGDKCTTIKDKDGDIDTGYIIMESTSNIAIYDTNQHAVIVKRTSDIVEQKTIFNEKSNKPAP